MTLARVFIIAPPRDVHAYAVSRCVEALGGECAVLDSRRFGPNVTATWLLGEPATLTTAAGNRVRLDPDCSIWIRRMYQPLLTEVIGREYRRFCQEEWMNLLDGTLDTSGARLINPPRAEEHCSKLTQLVAATEAGLRVPATIVSNSHNDVQEFVNAFNGQVIHKTTANLPSRLLETSPWGPQADAALPDLGLAPTMVQERIFGAVDLRITIVGEQLFAARIDSSDGHVVDSRLLPPDRFVKHTIEDEIARRLLNLMRQLGLVMGAIDMKVDSDGTPVFLEVNPQGQFLFIEIATGLPIAKAVGSLLLDRV